jgi:hypothetical protein
LSLAIEVVDDIDDCFDIALWSAAAAAPRLPTSTKVAIGRTGNFMAGLLDEPPPKKE